MTRKQVTLSKRQNKGWEAVAQALQMDIIFGRLQPRERLVEDDMMERFQVSRYVVRRAIDDMEAIGLIQKEANRGARVRGYSVEEVEGLFEIRELLEQHAVRRMPPGVNPLLIKHLRQIQSRHDEASESGSFTDLFHINNEFHATLYAACGNRVISEAIEHYSVQTQPIRMGLFIDNDRRKGAVREHYEMIEALERDDRDQLCEVIRRHLQPTKVAYLQIYSSR